MPNPDTTPCLHEVWTKVVDGLTNCTIHKYSKTPTYYHTYRVAGDPAPTDIPALEDGLEWESSTLVVNFEYEVDVYIYVSGNGGSVRVDA